MFLRSRRAPAGVTAAALIAAGFVALPPAASNPADQGGKPDKPGRQEIPLGQGKWKEIKGSHGKKFESDVITTDTFDVAGITWDSSDAADLEFSVRTRSDGQWSDWFELHADEHAPDPDTKEAKKARAGTDPLIAPNADAVELTVATSQAPPDGLQLDLINSEVTPEDTKASAPTMWTLAEDFATTASGGLKPSIRTREDWGADESIREPGRPEYGEIRGGFVHHTAGTNNYTREQVPGIIRGIYDYHVNTNGWRDIGYNFLIDRFGRTWEGRYGGMNRPVQGAHVRGYNSYSVGAAALGTFMDHEPPSAVRNAFKRLFGWKFTLHGVDPKRSVQYPNGLKKLRTISGHRDGGSTLCPGHKLYDRLGSVRGGAAKLVQTGTPFVGIQDADRDGDSDLLARHYNGTLWFFGGNGGGSLGSRTQVGSSPNWDRITAFTGGDFTSDGTPDLIYRRDTLV